LTFLAEKWLQVSTDLLLTKASTGNKLPGGTTLPEQR